MLQAKAAGNQMGSVCLTITSLNAPEAPKDTPPAVVR